MTIPLSLTTQAEIDVALDARQSRLFIVNAGVVQTFDTRTGTRVYATRTGTPYVQGMDGPQPAVDERAGLVFVPNLVDDAVSMLDARSGRVRRTLRVGYQPDTRLMCHFVRPRDHKTTTNEGKTSRKGPVSCDMKRHNKGRKRAIHA